MRVLRARRHSTRASPKRAAPFPPASLERAQKAISNLYMVMTHMQSMSLMVQISSTVHTISSGAKVAAEVMKQMNAMGQMGGTMSSINEFGKEAKEMQMSVRRGRWERGGRLCRARARGRRKRRMRGRRMCARVA